MEIKEFYEILDQKYHSGNPEEVWEYLNRTIETNWPCCGGFSDIYLSAINELGSFYRESGRYKESEKAFDDSAAMIAEYMGTDSVEYATNRNNLAGTLRLMGEYERGVRMFEEAGSLYEKHLGHFNHYTASVLNNEALIYIATGEKQKAEKCLEDALDIMRTLGDSQEKEAITLVNLAQVTGDENFLHEALSIYDKMADKGLHYGSALNMLGSFQFAKGRFEAARKSFQRAKEEIYQCYGESREYKQACENLARVSETGRGDAR